VDQLHAKSKPVVDALATLESVRGIVCYGSRAMATSDEHSDIDLFVLCEPDIVPSQFREECLRQIGGATSIEIGPESQWVDQWCPKHDRLCVNGTDFDVIYNTVGWIRSVVRGVTELGATSLDECRFRPYGTLAMLENCVVLYDPASVLQELRAKIYPYPAKLKEDLLAEGRATLADSLGELKNYVARDIGNTAFLFHLSRTLDAIGTILFALNERYNPATKRVEESYRHLSIVPADFLGRYDTMLQTPLTSEGREQIVEGLESLVKELGDMAEEHREG
jgi:hypothetical protein